VLVLTSPEFDFPCANLPPNVRYVGPQLADPTWAGSQVALPPGEEPLVLVSCSSTHMDQLGLIRRAVAAVADLPVRALVTTGPTVDPEEVRAGLDVGPAVSVVRSAPHSAVLPHASAVITHGGHGTVMKALAAGLPVVCLPLGRDQPDNAARLVAAGAGVRLKPKAGVGAIRAAVRQALDDPTLRAGAEKIGQAVAAQATSGLALDELEEVARGRGVRPLATPRND
jgi:MGT family glycosyltransferase